MSKQIKKAISSYQSPPMKPLEPVVIPPSDRFKEAVLEELRLLEQGKHDAHREPHHTTYIEFQRHISGALNVLFTEGKITVGRCVNDKYILTNPQGNEQVRQSTPTTQQ